VLTLKKENNYYVSTRERRNWLTVEGKKSVSLESDPAIVRTHQRNPSSSTSSFISCARWIQSLMNVRTLDTLLTESVTRDQKESVWAWFALKSQLKAVTLVNTLFFWMITSVTFGLINNRDNFNLRPTILFLIDCDQLKKKENVCQWRLSCYTVVDGEPAAVS